LARFLKPTEHQLDPFTVFTITMQGIEEAEQMERSVVDRFPTEHPYWFGVVVAVGATVLSKIADFLYAAVTAAMN